MSKPCRGTAQLPLTVIKTLGCQVHQTCINGLSINTKVGMQNPQQSQNAINITSPEKGTVLNMCGIAPSFLANFPVPFVFSGLRFKRLSSFSPAPKWAFLKKIHNARRTPYRRHQSLKKKLSAPFYWNGMKKLKLHSNIIFSFIFKSIKNFATLLLGCPLFIRTNIIITGCPAVKIL